MAIVSDIAVGIAMKVVRQAPQTLHGSMELGASFEDDGIPLQNAYSEMLMATPGRPGYLLSYK